MTQEEKTRAFEKCRRIENLSLIFSQVYADDIENDFVKLQYMSSSYMRMGMVEMFRTFDLMDEYIEYSMDKNREEFGRCIPHPEDIPGYLHSLSEVIDEVERI